MTGRPHAAIDPACELRPSVRVATLAEAWDCDVTQIRRLVDAGELEAHGLGTRALRIYLDSAQDYQARKVVASKPGKQPGPARRPRPPRSPVDNAAHRAAMATLRRQGVA